MWLLDNYQHNSKYIAGNIAEKKILRVISARLCYNFFAEQFTLMGNNFQLYFLIAKSQRLNDLVLLTQKEILDFVSSPKNQVSKFYRLWSFKIIRKESTSRAKVNAKCGGQFRDESRKWDLNMKPRFWRWNDSSPLINSCSTNSLIDHCKMQCDICNL